jgi:DNA-binding transcriptional MerR regulator
MVITMETMPQKWLTFIDLERETGTPGNTLRRWADAFQEFLPSRVEGRVRRFHSESVPTFKRIAGLFQEGKQTREVVAILAKDTSAVHDVALVSPPSLNESLTGGMPALVRAEIGRALGESLAVIANQRKRLDAQDAEIEELKRKVAILEASRTHEPKPQDQPKEPPKGFWARFFGG